ncbi:MAG TPA: glycoside hydrolase domain-containing protein [Nocardioides sp.]|uniref:glycoside hydrolase domain-containing protein n=1 Tax=Nocardioides sp. TaxID=35761 RepID=UPI002CB013AA|nr:glycoside hydrolase domain-containing protein [Nocardioides sp.]HTW18386.1 glycoside hydrolase domain-containing protein [Nocardioides sp.]
MPHVLTRLAVLASAAALSIATLSVPAQADQPATEQVTGQAPRAASTVRVPGSFTGYGFDACSAPSQQVMDAWRQASPYSAVGIYISGSLRTCPQDQLTADWVRTQARRGWHLLPIHVGPQASCAKRDYPIEMSLNKKTAEDQGRAEARSSVAAAKSLAIRTGSTLYYDLEDYDLAPDDCRQAALSFLSGWTKQLHALGFRSGVYSNIGAAINSLDVADRLSPGSYAMPDDIWFAWENGRADTRTDHRVQSRRWDKHARIHQYDLDTVRTYAGASMKIDLNWVDVGRGSVGSPTRRMCPGVAVDLRRYPTLRKGSRGAAVKAAQCQLRKQRFTRAKPSGRYDAGTVKAVRKAQRRLDVRVTGRLDRRTWVALVSRGSRPLLKVGSTGDPVRRVQRALGAALGIRIRVDGLMSPRTSKAVARFQKRERLERTGNVTIQTWQRLQAGG